VTSIDQTRASLLVRLAEDVDRSTWLEFFDRYGALIHGYARNRGCQAVDADDVVQDVLMALMKAMPNFEYDPKRGRFRGYLRTVTWRAVSAKARQNRDATPLDEVESVDPSLASPDADAVWEEEWRQYHVRRAMRVVEREVGERDLLAFRRYALGGESPQRTAEDLGLSIDQVYQAKSRILSRLTELIEHHRHEED